jgi:hypothetical protein
MWKKSKSKKKSKHDGRCKLRLQPNQESQSPKLELLKWRLQGSLYDNLSWHHLINRCNGWKDCKENMFRMKPEQHTAWHILFGNDTPVEAMIEILTIAKPSIWKGIREDLLEVFAKYKWNEYNNQCYKWKAIKGWWIKNLLINLMNDGEQNVIKTTVC